MHSYEALVRCAAAACGAPMASLAVVERERARFKASFGATCAEEVPLTFSLLAETLACTDFFTVEDARADERFATSPIVVAGPRVRAFAGVPLHGPDGTVVGVLAVADHRPGTYSKAQLASLQDFGRIASGLVVSSRELALRRLMSRAIEESLDFVLITDAVPPSEGGPFIQYANASLLHAFGYTADELDGKPYSFLVAPTSDPATVDSIAQNLEYARDSEKEMLVRRKDGSTFWIEFTGRPLLDEQGVPSHWVTVGRNITGNRDALRETAALLKALDSVGDHVEIYTFEDGAYQQTFQNAPNPPATAAIERALALSSTHMRLAEGEVIALAGIGTSLHPLANGETVVCVGRQAGERFKPVDKTFVRLARSR